MDAYSEQQIDHLLPDTGELLYSGSRILEPVCRRFGVQVDQINVVVSVLLSILLGWCYRHWLPPSKVSVEGRQATEVVLGFLLVHFVHGQLAWHILAQTLLCLIIMCSVTGPWMPRLVMIASMAYLSYIHIYRMIYRYMDQSIFIDGAIMISTTKLTALAWSISDGQQDQSSLHPKLRKHALASRPSLLASLSYVINFHSTLMGPFCFFDEHQDNVMGNNLQDEHALNQQIMNRLGETAILLMLMKIIFPLFPPSNLLSLPSDLHWAYRFFIVIWYVQVHRLKHYTVFKMSEATANSAGLAFNGYDKDNKPRWDLMENINISEIEWPQSLRCMVNSWHIKTSVWLRYIAYYRLPVARMPLTFVTSILWHGFYPGYFITGVQMVTFIPICRIWNKAFATPKKQEKGNMSSGDESNTPQPGLIFIITRNICLLFLTNYCMLPFVMLQFYASIRIYSDIYFIVNLFGCLVLAISVIKLNLSKKTHQKLE